MNTSKLILIRGNSGSGKTSAAQALQERFGDNTMLISADMVRMRILNTTDSGHKDKPLALPLMIYLLEYGRRHSEVVIVEGIMPTIRYMPLYEAAIREFGENIFAYYYDLPFEETLLRHSTKPNRGDFGEEDMRRWWREKDFIGIIPETILTKELSLSDAVDRIYEAVKRGK